MHWSFSWTNGPISLFPPYFLNYSILKCCCYLFSSAAFTQLVFSFTARSLNAIVKLIMTCWVSLVINVMFPWPGIWFPCRFIISTGFDCGWCNSCFPNTHAQFLGVSEPSHVAFHHNTLVFKHHIPMDLS